MTFASSMLVLFATACSSGSNKDAQAQAVADSIRAKKVADSVAAEKKKAEEAEAAALDKTVKLYWYLVGYNPDNGENSNNPRRENFNKENSICMDYTGFDQLQITGKAPEIKLIAYQGSAAVYTSEQFNASEKKSFKKFGKFKIAEDQSLNIDKIEIIQRDKVIFSGKITYMNCE
jgi:hypothetical protein